MTQDVYMGRRAVDSRAALALEAELGDLLPDSHTAPALCENRPQVIAGGVREKPWEMKQVSNHEGC